MLVIMWEMTHNYAIALYNFIFMDVNCNYCNDIIVAQNYTFVL